jgi:regulator of sigma E protease
MIHTLLSNLESTIVFAIVLGILIIVHEWGHFITAKKMGVKVEEFALGFGPTLWSKIHNGTHYMIKAIPLGGYVKMFGDDRTKLTGHPEEYYSQPPGRRALIILNGPVVNYLLAYVCLFFVFLLGYPDLSTKIGDVMKDYPAQTAGLMKEDKIVSINGIKLEGWTHLQSVVSQSKEPTLKLEVIRNEQPLNLEIIPRLEKTKNIFGQEKQARLIGIRPAEDITTFKYSPLMSLKKAADKLIEITVLTYKAFYFMITGTMSAKESVTGPIGIFYIVKSATEMGFVHVLLILGLISASLAIFNLVPMIPLDGGHLFLLAIEKIRGKALPVKIDEYIARFGFSLIILLAIFVFYSDFSRFGWIEKIQGIFH